MERIGRGSFKYYPNQSL